MNPVRTRLVALLMLSATGCEKSTDAPLQGQAPEQKAEERYAFQMTLPFKDSPLDLLVEDMDADGRLDVAAISHGNNYGQIFFQMAPRQYRSGPRLDSVGFHPGDWLRWRTAVGLWDRLRERAASTTTGRGPASPGRVPPG